MFPPRYLGSVATPKYQRGSHRANLMPPGLVRLRQQQALEYESRTTQHETRAKLDEAYRKLSAVYSWFTEGFETKDLQEAKALLGTGR